MVEIEYINIFFYIFFHLTFIYFLFYHYHYSIFFLGLFYGVFFDIFLINEIGSHLLCFIILISIYVLLKKYLFLLSSYQVSIIIYIVLILTLFSEVMFALLFNNIYFSFSSMLKYILFSLIIYIPSIFILNKIDN